MPSSQALTKFIKQHATVEYELPKKSSEKEEKEETQEETKDEL